MTEFTISFSYQDKEQKAGVMKSFEGSMVEYDVRPIEPETVKKFGKQIIIYKEAEDFNSDNHIDEDYTVFFEAVVTAIKEQDTEEASPV